MEKRSSDSTKNKSKDTKCLEEENVLKSILCKRISQDLSIMKKRKVLLTHAAVEFSGFSSNKQLTFEEDSSDTEDSRDGKNLSKTLKISAKLILEEKQKDYKDVSQMSHIPLPLVTVIIDMLDNNLTIPFMLRYRKHLIGNLKMEELWFIKGNYKVIKVVNAKRKKLKKYLSSLGHLTQPFSKAIDSCLSCAELDYLRGAFRGNINSQKLNAILNLGLSKHFNDMLDGNCIIDFQMFVEENVTIEQVENLAIAYFVKELGDDPETRIKVLELVNSEQFLLLAKKNEAKLAKEDFACYKKYFNVIIDCDKLRPDQLLGIFRGESNSILQLSILIRESFRLKISEYTQKKWLTKGISYDLRTFIFNKAIKQMISCKINYLVQLLLYSRLKIRAEKINFEFFYSNLRYLLLTPPVQKKTICGIDANNEICKFAIIKGNGQYVCVEQFPFKKIDFSKFEGCQWLEFLQVNAVEIISISFDKKRSEIEKYIAYFIETGLLNAKYTVVIKHGIPNYCDPQNAIENYPGILPRFITAISLARRIIDPLTELVKLDLMKLRGGLYQKGINWERLQDSIEAVVSLCVSEVGVDINTAPLAVLKRVPGLTEEHAKSIIKRREEHPFENREDLKTVNGMGLKNFQQCAGFVKILGNTIPEKEGGDSNKINYLDKTIIHPEEYRCAFRLLTITDLYAKDIGKVQFIEKLTRKVNDVKFLNAMTLRLKIQQEKLRFILEGFTTPLDYDIRSEFEEQLFRKQFIRISDLEIDDKLEGQITCITTYGAYVDIGVEKDGLLPHIFIKDFNLHRGQHIQVKVIQTDCDKPRVWLGFISLLNSKTYNQ